MPLLSRWKHAGPAIDYVKRGTLLHNLLPRTLQLMTGSGNTSNNLQPVLDQLQVFLASSAASNSDTLHDVVECDLSMATENAKRQSQIAAFFNQEDFSAQVRIMDFMLRPFDRRMDFLIHRTHDLHKLTHLIELQSLTEGLMILTIRVMI